MTEMKVAVDSALTVIAILFILVLVVLLTGCTSASPKRVTLPYSYPVYAMPHGNEFHTNVVEENPILIDTTIVP